MFCYACQLGRSQTQRFMDAPWDQLLSQYEFMIAFASFQRNITFYSSMDHGQLKRLYSQLVSFSPARILVIDHLISTYTERGSACERNEVSHELCRVITLALGNAVPQRFIHKCISQCSWSGPENMILASFASVENIRGGPLKYMAIIKAHSKCNTNHIQAIISLAITGWMMKLWTITCTCGTWAQALEMVSCSVPDTETSLSLQDEARVCAYICTLLSLTPRSREETARGENREPLDYVYIFSELFVAGLNDPAKTHH